MTSRDLPEQLGRDSGVSDRGRSVLGEIASQPECWTIGVDRREEAAAVLPQSGERVALIGCGTSFHIAAALAVARESAGHGETDAFPASELPSRPYDAVVAITRSGTTTEVLEALSRLASPVRKIVVTTAPTLPVAELADGLLILDYADEKSVVQTRFATTVLSVVRAHLGHDLGPVIDQAATVLAAELNDEWIDRSHYVFLGREWAVGIAGEGALKVREAASAWSEVYPAMEYRHGPLSVASAETLVWCFGDEDQSLVTDIERAGATVVGSTLDPQADLVRVQRVAVATALARGLDPDRPRHLNRSVVLTGRG